jgi:hypothetical protein
MQATVTLERRGCLDLITAFMPVFLGGGELYWGKGLVGDVAKGFGDLNCIVCLPSGDKMNGTLDISRG